MRGNGSHLVPPPGPGNNFPVLSLSWLHSPHIPHTHKAHTTHTHTHMHTRITHTHTRTNFIFSSSSDYLHTASALFLSCRTSCLPTQVGIQPAGDPHRHHDIGSCQSHSGLWMSGILPPVQTRVSRGSCVMSQPGSIVGSCPSRHPIPSPSDIWESRLLSPVSKGDETLKAPPGYNNKIK